MNSTEKNLIQFELIANQWIGFVDTYTEEQFLRKPSEESWSIGQVYNHLINSALNFHLKQIEICANGTGTLIQGGKSVKGKISFLLGSFPPIRVKVPPSPQYTPLQPKSKQEVKEKLGEVIKAVANAKHKVESAAPQMKTTHPAFGYLNAAEWFQIIPMHYRHHLRQKRRLDAFLSLSN